MLSSSFQLALRVLMCGSHAALTNSASEGGPCLCRHAAVRRLASFCEGVMDIPKGSRAHSAAPLRVPICLGEQPKDSHSPWKLNCQMY